MEESIVNGQVKNFIFEAKDSLYKICKILTDDGKEFTIVGYFPLLSIDLRYEFKGIMINHPKYGEQLKVTNFKRLNFDSKEGIIAFLSSDKFKGIGEKTALRIYQVLGDKCLDLISKDYTSLYQVGFKEPKAKALALAINSNKAHEEIFVELYNYGLTPKMVSKLYDKYLANTVSYIKENPYRLIYEVDGFGFLKSDQLALTIGFSVNDKRRIKEGIIYSLTYVCNMNGFVFLTDNQLINSTYNLINKGLNADSFISKEVINDLLLELILDNRLIKEENRIYLKYLYDNEYLFSRMILNINANNSDVYKNELLVSKLSAIENDVNIKYTHGQKEAIFNSINHNLSIITGGPGTGKTTIIKGILRLYASLIDMPYDSVDYKNFILLVAPTGRAAKRICESTGMKASTIHKALGYDFEGNFSFNENNRLLAKLIIIDEASMIDINLAKSFFDAINPKTKVIIVGDEFQLPSVGPGNVLHDLISSNIISVTKLTEIMRQSLDSDIINFSHGIKNRYIDQNIFLRKKEAFFYETRIDDVINKIIKFIDAYLVKGGDLLNDLEILVPMYKGVAGIDAINHAIQEKFNSSDNTITRGEKFFKENDKVMQLSNDPTLNIMNGDIGVIKGIVKNDDEEYLLIDFDSNMVKYLPSNFDNLTLAYAISIHKSQGSEYKNVILPVLSSYYTMLKRNLIYTAVTRAKEKIILIGSYKSLLDGVNSNDDLRQTTLVRRLNNLGVGTNVIYINDPEIPFETLGEENMENITPYSFM